LNSRECLSRLVGGVQQDILDYHLLRELLLAQHDQLRQRDAQGLTSSLESQRQLVAKLQTRARERSDWLRLLGFSGNDGGMRQLLGRLPGPLQERLAPHWQQLQALVQACQQQNERNGRTLLCQHEVIRRMLYGEPSNDYRPSLPGTSVPY